MSFLLYLTAFLASFHSTTTSQLLDPLVYGSADGNFNILLEMGDPPQMVYLRLDMSHPASWITHNVYRPEHSYSCTKNGEPSSLQLGFFSYDSLIKKETLKMSRKNLNLTDFYFHYLDIDRPEGTYDSLSLSYSFKDLRMSFIHQLYESGSLSKKQFSYVPLDGEVGYLYLGYLPLEKMKNEHYVHIASCKVNPAYSTWGCNIDKVFIDSNVYESNHYAYFNPTNKYSLVPHSFISFFTETFMREYLDNGICKYENSIGTYRCDCTQMKDVPKVVIMLGGEKVELDMHVLFSSYRLQCDFKFKTNEMNMNWVFGSSFIKDYIIRFDYDKARIDMYSNRTAGSGGYEKGFMEEGRGMSMGKVLMWVGVGLFVCVGVVVLYIKGRNWIDKKNAKKKRKRFYNQHSLIE